MSDASSQKLKLAAKLFHVHSFVVLLIFSFFNFIKKKCKQKDYFHIQNTDIVAVDYNVVTYNVGNTYIIVAYNGNIFAVGN